MSKSDKTPRQFIDNCLGDPGIRWTPVTADDVLALLDVVDAAAALMDHPDLRVAPAMVRPLEAALRRLNGTD